MTDHDKPSIAALQQAERDGEWEALVDAASVLLEIAATALAAEEARVECDALSAKWVKEGGDYELIARSHARIDETVRVRFAALVKVRP